MKLTHLLTLLALGAVLGCTGCTGSQNPTTPEPSTNAANANVPAERQKAASDSRQMGRQQAEAMKRNPK